MQLDNVLEAKGRVFRELFRYESVGTGNELRAWTLGEDEVWRDPGLIEAAARGGEYLSPFMKIALGVGVPSASAGDADYALLALVQDRRLMRSNLVDRIIDTTRGETIVRYVGQVRRASAPAWHASHCRPLRIGCSIGHHRVSAGTLGCFVRHRRSGSICVLSNNHVLAWSNAAGLADAILQPGRADGGAKPTGTVAGLAGFVPIRFAADGGSNMVDAAIAAVLPGIDIETRRMDPYVPLAGLAVDMPRKGDLVRKIGRTTGAREGRVLGIEVDNLRVRFGAQAALFDRQMTFEGAHTGAFSKPGDSGSVIVDGQGNTLSLLFAGSEEGGANGRGLTFGNPISDVLVSLDAELYI